MTKPKPRFTKAEAERLQQKVFNKRTKKPKGKESSIDLVVESLKVHGFEGRIRKIEKTLTAHETRMDNIMVRLFRLEMGREPAKLTQTVVLKKRRKG